MKSMVVNFAAGLLFAVGLGVAGMTNPSKVVGFLDVFGDWDASLAFVMVGGIAVYGILSRIFTKRAMPLFDTRFHLPSRKDIDLRLVLGAGIFGVGWALAGYCPGPGLVTAASGVASAGVFVISMALGMKVEHRLSQWWGARHPPSSA